MHPKLHCDSHRSYSSAQLQGRLVEGGHRKSQFAPMLHCRTGSVIDSGAPAVTTGGGVKTNVGDVGTAAANSTNMTRFYRNTIKLQLNIVNHRPN
jgi:hypothetical protein